MQLVVFHDGALTRAFPREGPNEAAIRQLESEGVDFEAASVQVSWMAPGWDWSSLEAWGRQLSGARDFVFLHTRLSCGLVGTAGGE